MTDRIKTLTSIVTLLVMLALCGTDASATDNRVADAAEEPSVLAVARITDLESRWPEVEAVPGLAELFTSLAEQFGVDPALFPRGLGPDALLVARPGGEGRLLSIDLARDASALGAPRLDLADWPWRLERSPLVRVHVDASETRETLRDWASARAVTPAGLIAWVSALDLHGIQHIYATRDLVEGKLVFDGLVVTDEAVPGDRFDGLFDAGDEGVSWEAPGAIVGAALTLAAHMTDEDAEARDALKAIASFVNHVDRVSITVRYDDRAIAMSGEITFEEDTPDRP